MKILNEWYRRILAVRGVKFVVDLFGRFGADNGALYAAGLAFFMLLSFVPIILTAVAVLGFFIDVHTASQKVTEMVQNLLPSGGARDEATKFLTVQLKLDDQVKAIVQHRGVAGVIGFLSLLWTTMQIFINLATGMNAMWEVKESRNWFVVRGISLALLVITGLLSVISLVLSGLPTAIARFHGPIAYSLPMPLATLTVLSECIAVVVNAVMYTVIYKLLPNAKVDWKAAVIGGLTASVLYEIAKKAVATYLLKANHSVYGALADLILFILWIYYSMTILMLGAEVCAAASRGPTAQQGAVKRHESGPRRHTRGERIRYSSKLARRSL